MNVLITVSEFGRKLKQKNESISDFLFFSLCLQYIGMHILQKKCNILWVIYLCTVNDVLISHD